MTPTIDRAAFDRRIRAEMPRLRRMAWSILRDRHDVDDVVNHTLIGVWQHCCEGRVDNLQAYAARAVWTNAVRHRTRRKHHAEYSDEVLMRGGVDHEADEPDLTAWEMEEAIAALPPLQQVAIRLRFYTRLGFEEMAETLSISVNTAASRTRYGMAALKKTLNILMKEYHHGTDA